MAEPYSIEINLKRNRIIFHYENAPDFVLDKNAARRHVQKDIDALMPTKKIIDQMVINEINMIRKQQPEVKAWLDSDECKKAALLRVTNRCKSEIEDTLAGAFAEEKVNDVIKETWKDILSLKEEIK